MTKICNMIKGLLQTWEQYKGKIPKPLKNKFVLLVLVFFVYMLFFDKHNLVTQFQLYMTERNLERDKRNYLSWIEEAREARKDLEENKEKYAREKYFIQRPGEDVFIIVREQ